MSLQGEMTSRAADAPALAEVAAFLYEEARLLDDREFEKWMDLFTDDGIYWVPAKKGQESPHDHVSLFYDDKEIMRTRITRLRHPKIHVQTPHAATIHLISNVTLGAHDAASGEFVAHSNFIMFEDRPADERRLHAGRYSHTLRRVDGRIRIARKRVDLTNCDASLPALALPF
jgi:3-phenylpropionate/cinnamic acid dioxygenase small subunit